MYAPSVRVQVCYATNVLSGKAALAVLALTFILCINTGEMINDKDRCGQCKGEKVVQDKKVLEVHVEKGMQNGQKITFQGEADEAVITE
jgi:DnaJ-class molecular chaperone